MYTEVTDGVYEVPLHGARVNSRAYLFDWAEPTLVDAGEQALGETLVAALADIGVDPDHLVITHADFDHIGGFDTVVEAFGPETWVPAESKIDVRGGESSRSLSSAPDNRFEHGDEVGPFEAVHVPGHCADNYAFVAEQHDIGVLGDVVIGADRRGLPAGYFLPPEAIYSLDLIDAERYLDRLLEYEFEIGLVAHGSSVFEDASTKLENYLEFPDKPSWSESRRSQSDH